MDTRLHAVETPVAPISLSAPETPLAPVSTAERIASIDVVRGLAVRVVTPLRNLTP